MSFLSAVIEGVLLGGYYGMIACGLSFMFGIMKIINLAHGSLAILAAFMLWTIAERMGYDPFLALIVVLPAMGCLGWLLQRGILERSARSGELVPILSTFGLAIVVENGVIFLLLRSRLGSSIQAIRDNEEAAASVGVRVLLAKRIIFVIAAVGCALAGGLWLATFTTFQPRSFFGIQWSAYMIFMVLVGGIGRFEGPILGAIIFFLIETWLGSAGVWYLIVLGLTALLFSLFLPKGIWGYIEDRFHVLLLPVGYRVQISTSSPIAGPSEALQ